MGMGWLLFGGLSVLSMQSPHLGWDWRSALGVAPAVATEPLEQVRSAGMLFMFMVVLVVIAYFTNPNEASFRTFLTELTFRRHLTQLHIPVLSSHDEKSKAGSVMVHKGASAKAADGDKTIAKSSGAVASKQSAGLLFSNRAAVSFRTGPHTLRSFGLFSLGIVQPVLNPPAPGDSIVKPATSGKGGRLSSSAVNGTSAATIADESGSQPEDLPGLWIIGAFGTWWIGGPLVPVPQRKGRGKEKCKDGKGSSARIISVHKLDAADSVEAGVEADISSPALRLPSRPSTPPPLPKSVSLPLHTQQSPVLAGKPYDSTLSPSRVILPQSPSHAELAANSSSLQTPSSPPQLFSNEPAVVELLAEIKAAEAAVSEVQTQIDQVRAQSAEQHEALNASVEQQRERKRQDEAEKKELKTKTRALDEARRQAENVRKDAEKKLRGIQAARDGAAQKKQRLEREILELTDAVRSHAERVKTLESEGKRKEVEAKEEVEQKTVEIQTKEAEVVSLTERAQGLEEKLKHAEDRLKRVREEEQKRQARIKAEQVARAAHATFEQQMKDQRFKHHPHHRGSPFRGGQPHVHTKPHIVHSHSTHSHHQPSLFERRQMAQHQHQHRNVSGPALARPETHVQPTGQAGTRSRSLSLKGARASEPGEVSPVQSATANALAQRAKGYSIFDQDIAAAGNTPPPSFGAFNPAVGEGNGNLSRGMENLLSPAAASFLPSNLLAEHSPRMVPDESPYFDSPSSPTFENGEISGGQSSFEVRRHSQPSELARSGTEDWRAVGSGSRRGSQHGLPENDMKNMLDKMMEQAASIAVAGLSSFDRYNDQRAAFSPRHDSAPHSPIVFDHSADQMDPVVTADGKRRWFSSKKPALNPDAKVFTPPSSFMASSTSLPQINTGAASFSSRFMPWRASNQNTTLPTSLFADLPVSSSDGPNFFSSLRAFQPSADELRALGVGNPASRSRETVNSFGSSGGPMVDLPSPSSIYAPGLPHIAPGPFDRSSRPVSNNASQVSLDKSLASTAAAVAAAWEADNAKHGRVPSSSSSKRPFGRWWSRSKEAVNTTGEEDKPHMSLGPIERPTKASPNSGDAEA